MASTHEAETNPTENQFSSITQGRSLPVPETVAEILECHRAGRMTPAATVTRTFARIRQLADPAVFITLRAEAEAVADARALTQRGVAGLPLYGIPVAVK